MMVYTAWGILYNSLLCVKSHFMPQEELNPCLPVCQARDLTSTSDTIETGKGINEKPVSRFKTFKEPIFKINKTDFVQNQHNSTCVADSVSFTRKPEKLKSFGLSEGEDRTLNPTQVGPKSSQSY